MKKLALVAAVMALVVVMSVSASAQGKMFLNIGGDAMLPIGDWSDVTSLGIGGTVRFEYAFMPELHGTFTTGYWMFMGKEVNSVDLPNTNGIPILVGAKYYFMPAAKAKARVYGAAELGLLIMSMGDKDLMYNGVKIGTIEGGSSTEFCLAPTVGVEFPIADNGNLDISAKYLLITSDPTASNIGFRLGYKFGLN